MKKLYREYVTIYHQPKDRYKDITKKERADACKNIICNRCKYQNYSLYVEKYGTCHLCGATLDIDYFKKKIKRKCREL